MTTTTKNLLSILLLAFSLMFLFAANNMASSAELLDANCYHCGSVSACDAGGQAYGWDGCVYDATLDPPENCSVYGGAACGTLPGEN